MRWASFILMEFLIEVIHTLINTERENKGKDTWDSPVVWVVTCTFASFSCLPHVEALYLPTASPTLSLCVYVRVCSLVETKAVRRRWSSIRLAVQPHSILLALKRHQSFRQELLKPRSTGSTMLVNSAFTWWEHGPQRPCVPQQHPSMEHLVEW